MPPNTSARSIARAPESPWQQTLQQSSRRRIRDAAAARRRRRSTTAAARRRRRSTGWQQPHRSPSVVLGSMKHGGRAQGGREWSSQRCAAALQRVAPSGVAAARATGGSILECLGCVETMKGARPQTERGMSGGNWGRIRLDLFTREREGVVGPIGRVSCGRGGCQASATSG